MLPRCGRCIYETLLPRRALMSCLLTDTPLVFLRYGVPGHDAEKFEETIKKSVYDRFVETPDLLYHV